MVFEKRPIIAPITGCMSRPDVYSASGEGTCVLSPRKASILPAPTHPPGLLDSRLRAKAAYLLVVGQLDPLPRDFAGGRPLVRTAAVHRVQKRGSRWEVLGGWEAQVT